SRASRPSIRTTPSRARSRSPSCAISTSSSRRPSRRPSAAEPCGDTVSAPLWRLRASPRVSARLRASLGAGLSAPALEFDGIEKHVQVLVFERRRRQRVDELAPTEAQGANERATSRELGGGARGPRLHLD